MKYKIELPVFFYVSKTDMPGAVKVMKQFCKEFKTVSLTAKKYKAKIAKCQYKIIKQ